MTHDVKFHDNGTATVTATSPTGRKTTATVNLNIEEYNAWHRGGMIQDCMPRMSSDERELFLSGFGKEEWDEMFKDDEE